LKRYSFGKIFRHRSVHSVIFLTAICFFVSAADSLVAQAQNQNEKSKLLTIAFIGDSLTEGLGVDREIAYPIQIEQLFKSKFQKSANGKSTYGDVKVINSGVSGATSSNGQQQFKWVMRTKPDWIVLALGANDGLRGLPVANLEINLQTVIDSAKSANVRVLLAGMRVPPNFGKSYAAQFESVYARLAKKNPHILYVPFLLESVAGEKEFNQPDGIHPNEKGHKKMAEMIYKALEKKL
jgi:acyl-CoA thioesterase-1